MASMHADVTRRRFFSLCAGALVAAVGAGLPAEALAAPTGSIVLKCRYDETPLAGDTYALARVATAELDEASGAVVSYRLCDDFSIFDLDWDALSSSELDERARQMATAARERGLFEREARSDAAGEVGFWGLEPGLYLVDRVQAAEANEAYACEPLLIGVPSTEDGASTYNVTSRPKFAYAGEPSIPTEDGGEEPQTGTDEPPASSDGGPLAETGDALAQFGGSLALVGVVSLLVSRLTRGEDEAAGPRD